MAIGTDSVIDFFGTQDEPTVANPGQVTDGSFSVAGDVSAWVNDDDAPLAAFVLVPQFATKPAAGKVIELHARLKSIQGTNNQSVPSTNYENATFLGTFVVDADMAVDTDMHLPLIASLPNHKTSQNYEFYIKNKTGQTVKAGWDLFVTPITQGPHP